MNDAPAELREQIRRACAEADGFHYEHLEPYDYQRHADALLALRDREMERMKVLVAASESPGHAVRLAAQYADRAIENGERATRLEERLRLLTDEKVASVVGPNIDLLCEEISRLKAEVSAARRFAAEMRDFCPPHGVAVDYADRLVEAMDRAAAADRSESSGVREVRIVVQAPTDENAASWAETIRDLVVAEYGDSMRLEVTIVPGGQA